MVVEGYGFDIFWDGVVWHGTALGLDKFCMWELRDMEYSMVLI